MPVRALVTSGVTADCTKASELIEGIEAQYLFADRGYDSDAIVDQARRQGMQVVISPKKNRKEQREYDKYLYKIRHLVENAFFISRDGEELLLAMQKGRPPILPLFKSDAFSYGLKYCDGTI